MQLKRNISIFSWLYKYMFIEWTEADNHMEVFIFFRVKSLYKSFQKNGILIIFVCPFIIYIKFEKYFDYRCNHWDIRTSINIKHAFWGRGGWG